MRSASLRGLLVMSGVAMTAAVFAGCTALLGSFEVGPSNLEAGPGIDSSTADAPSGDGAPTCGAPTIACGAICVDTANDPKNCSACGSACASGPCFMGKCTDVKCEAGVDQCGTLCTSLQTDVNHCGNCATKCPLAQSCVAGKCTMGGCPGTKTACPDSSGMPVCVDLKTDNDHCGSCPIRCDTTKEQCGGGRCFPKPLVHLRFDGNFDNSGTAGASYAFASPVGPGGIVPNGRLGTKGFNAYGSIPGARNILTTARVTMSIWMNATQSPSNPIFHNWGTTGPFGGVELGWVGANLSGCFATKSFQYISGQCLQAAAPQLGSWHNFVIRADGQGLGDGQGGPVAVFVDGLQLMDEPNITKEAVFNSFQDLDLALGFAPGYAVLDEVKIYDAVFDLATQCVLVSGGMWDAANLKCILPP